MRNERDEWFSRVSKEYEDTLAHNASIVCYALEPPQESEAVKIWREYVKIERTFEVVWPVYKMVRRYALQWRPMRWAPHFYDLVEELSHHERRPISYLRELRSKRGLFIELTYRTAPFARRVPVMPNPLFSYAGDSDKPIATHTETVTYEFPRLGYVQQLSLEGYERMYRDTGFVEAMEARFRFEAEKLIEQQANIRDERTWGFDNLPTLRITRERV